jgi:hypothetical protein
MIESRCDKKLNDSLEATTVFRLNAIDLIKDFLNKLDEVKICKDHQRLIVSSAASSLIQEVVSLLIEREKSHGIQT